ncbi:MAG: low temperature requirement protein A [Pedobacter sp.]|nr:low temperature requirement protein A [Pedobacter sp.]
MTRSTTMLRLRPEHGHNKVTFVELFFDLIFVFAITQLSHLLLHHFSLHGAAETLMLLLAVWWVWIFTSWVTNWLDPEVLPVRVFLLVLMLAGLLLSSSIPQAFAERGLVFACAYVFMQVGRSLFTLWAFHRHKQHIHVRNFLRILVWLSSAGLFWIAGGLLSGEDRLLCWLIALLIEYISPSLGFWTPGLGRSTTTDWNVEGAHLAERCGLFIIIALGESVLVTGATFAELTWNSATVTAFIISFIGSVTMWWLYFDVGAEIGSYRMSHSQDSGRMARLAYTYLHLPIVGGIIVSAVADEFVLGHPLGHGELKFTLAILGGAALYLFGITVFKWAVVGRFPVSHLLALIALGLLAIPAGALSPLWLSLATTLVLIALAAWERFNAWRCAPAEVHSSADSH